MRGLDLMVAKNFHNACAPTCASWPREDNHIPFFLALGGLDPGRPRRKVYATPSRVPALRLTPGVNSGYKWGSFSWTTRNGQPFKLPALDNDTDRVRERCSAAIPAVHRSSIRSSLQRKRLTDQVMDDYRRVLGTPRRFRPPIASCSTTTWICSPTCKRG